MKKLAILAVLAMIMGVFSSTAIADTISFTDGEFFSFTGQDGVTLTLDDNNGIAGWDDRGLMLKLSNENEYLSLIFSAAVNIGHLNYSHGSKKATLLIYVGTDSATDTLIFDPSKEFLDLSAYSGITSLKVALLEGANADTGNFYLSGLTYGASAVPVPAAVWLLGSGLVGIVALHRKLR